MNAIAKEAVKITLENVADGATIKEVKLFFKNQKNNILLYLLSALKMGELLHDTTLDDDTNKMEGSISSLIHSLGNIFTNPTTNEEIKEDDVTF